MLKKIKNLNKDTKMKMFDRYLEMARSSKHTQRAKSDLVCVYGTLMSYNLNSPMNDLDANKIGEVKLPGFQVYAFTGGNFVYPILAKGSPSRPLHCEVFKLDDPDVAFEQLDDYEGVSAGLYTRALIDLPDGRKAYIYFIKSGVQDDEVIKIQSNNWLDFYKKNKGVMTEIYNLAVETDEVMDELEAADEELDQHSGGEGFDELEAQIEYLNDQYKQLNLKKKQLMAKLI